MLTALLDGMRVTAAAAPLDRDYRCPDAECGARVILKRGTIRIAHFAHHPGSVCSLAGESLAHMSAKLHIAEEYCRRGFTADVEVPVFSPLENRRADVLIASPRNPQLRYAIEVQDSIIGETELWQRTRSYQAARIRPVCISLLRPDKWTTSKDTDGRTIVEKYSPRLHERWIEQMAGDLWLYDYEAREFWRATFEEHLLWRGGADYIDVGLGEHIQIDPYQVPSERWVKVVVGEPCKLGQIRVAANPQRPVGTLIGIDVENPG
jgi:hypothetical protein